MHTKKVQRHLFFDKLLGFCMFGIAVLILLVGLTWHILDSLFNAGLVLLAGEVVGLAAVLFARLTMGFAEGVLSAVVASTVVFVVLFSVFFVVPFSLIPIITFSVILILTLPIIFIIIFTILLV